jgi:hypothetical protein
MAVGVPERSLRDMAAALSEFEGVRCLWRVVAALAVYTLIRVLPVVAAVIVAIVSVNGPVAAASVSAVVALAVEALGKKLRVRFPWKAVLANRLFKFEAMNPATQVPVRVRAADEDVAGRALRRARFNPVIYGLRVGSVPLDAPDLDCEIAVHEPAARRQSRSDPDRVQRIADVLRGAQVRARVAGVDVVPSPGDVANA